MFVQKGQRKKYGDTWPGRRTLLRQPDSKRYQFFIAIEQLNAPMTVQVKTRYSQKEQTAVIYPRNNNVFVEFEKPQRAVYTGAGRCVL